MTDTKPGDQVDGGKARVFPCEGCGADLEFHIGQQDLKCPFCGFEKQLEFAEDAAVVEQDLDSMLARMREHQENNRQDEDGQNEISCDSCGGTVVFQGTLTSTECPFCASPIQRENVHDAEHRVPVDGVLPFLVEKDVATQNLKAWVGSDSQHLVIHSQQWTTAMAFRHWKRHVQKWSSFGIVRFNQMVLLALVTELPCHPLQANELPLLLVKGSTE